jgi:hypothetical protein
MWTLMFKLVAENESHFSLDKMSKDPRRGTGKIEPTQHSARRAYCHKSFQSLDT